MKNKVLCSILLFPLVSFALLAQTLTFEAEQLTIDPADVATNKCVQYGLFMTLSGATASYAGFTVTFDYTAPAGFTSAAPSVAAFHNNQGLGLNDGNGATPGGGDPLTMVLGSEGCATGDLLNSTTLGGSAETFLTVLGGTSPVNLSDNTGATPTAGHYRVNISDFSNNLFTLNDGVRYLFAVVEFPLVGAQGYGQIDFTFDGASDGCIVSPLAGAVVNAGLTDGYIRVYSTTLCGAGVNYATFTDSIIGTTTATTQNGNDTMELAFLDPTLTGPGTTGSQVGVVLTYGAGVTHYQITGPAAYDTGVLALDGTSPDTATAIDVPLAGGTYSIDFFTNLITGSPISVSGGAPCTIDTSLLPASCNASWSHTGPGSTGTMTLTLTNAFPDSGNGNLMATITPPVGSSFAVTTVTTGTGPDSTVGSTLTYTIYNNTVNVGDVGDYAITDLLNPADGSTAVPQCSGALGFNCPGPGDFAFSCSTDVTYPTGAGDENPATIDVGENITVNPDISNINVIGWQLMYNGQILPTPTTFYTSAQSFTTIAGANEFYVRAYGFSDAPCYWPIDGSDGGTQVGADWWYECQINWEPCPSAADFPFSCGTDVNNNTGVEIAGAAGHLDIEVLLSQFNSVAPPINAVAAQKSMKVTIQGYEVLYNGVVTPTAGDYLFAPVAGADSFYVRAVGQDRSQTGTVECAYPDNNTPGAVQQQGEYWFECQVNWGPARCDGTLTTSTATGSGDAGCFQPSDTLADVHYTPSVANDNMNAVEAWLQPQNVQMTWDAGNGWWAAPGPIAARPITQVILTGPDGQNVTCDGLDLVNVYCCSEVTLTIGGPGTVGFSIAGAAEGASYEIWYGPQGGINVFDSYDFASDPSFTQVTPDLTLVGGVAANTTHVVQPDSYYYVVCQGANLVAAATAMATVPTFGQWSLVSFAFLLVLAGLVIIRRLK